MGRRTITLTSSLETAIRRKQAKLIEKQNRDISFTEVLNRLLAAVIALADMWDLKKLTVAQIKRYEDLLEGVGFTQEAALDTLYDLLPQKALVSANVSPSLLGEA